MAALKRAFKNYQLVLICWLVVAGYWLDWLGGWCLVNLLGLRRVAPKLTSCDVFVMLVEYWLSAEGGFGGGENVNPVGVLVTGGELLSLLVSVSVTGGDITHCWEEVALCDACCCDVC